MNDGRFSAVVSAALAVLGLVSAVSAAVGLVVAMSSGSSLAGASGAAETADRSVTARAPATPASAVPADPEVLALPSGHPEARLAAAYEALDAGQTDTAFEIAAALVRDRPDFALAQVLHADLLASRAGHPLAFGADLRADPTVPAPVTDLLDEARLRWAALRDRPRKDQVPAEFLRLPSSVRHAVAVDASRSRLYLFKNTPGGLLLQSDHYVSLGKHGVGKRVEGDSRTPLGIYWTVQGVRGPMKDERLGLAALGFNYPNAWDRLQGRTGRGLYVHGVPRDVFTRAPLATDGCVAMANDDATMLLDTVDAENTPVLISQRITWVEPGEPQAPWEGFEAAFQAWDRARQAGDREALARWYERDAAIAAVTLEAGPPREPPSMIGWSGDTLPLVVTSSRATQASKGKPMTYRQYWARRDGEWRIVFDGMLPLRPQEEADSRRAQPL